MALKPKYASLALNMLRGNALFVDLWAAKQKEWRTEIDGSSAIPMILHKILS